MDEIQVKQSLEEHFKTNRLVLWYDDNAQFCDCIPQIDGVTILNLKDEPHLKVRVAIDIENKNDKFLLYAPYSKPPVKEDWFIDVSKYAPQFKADRSTIILNDLGLAGRQVLLPYISERLKFFNNKERFAKFKNILLPNDEEKEMDFKIISILTKSDKADIFSIIISIFCDWTDAEDVCFDNLPQSYVELEKMNMSQAFWKYVAEAFGYEAETPNLKDLALRLFASDMLVRLPKENHPAAIRKLVLNNATNSFICLNQWRESNRYYPDYDIFSNRINDELNVSKWVGSLDFEFLLEVPTFLSVEKQIIGHLIEDVLQAPAIVDNQQIINATKKRLDGYWANRNLKDTIGAKRSLYCRLYDAIAYSSDMVVEINKMHLDSIEDFDSLYNMYVKELYKIDLLYRKAIEAIQQVSAQGIDVLKKLQGFVEDFYTNKYIETLAIKLNRTVNFAMSDGWKVKEAYNQYEFFNRYVKSTVEKGDKVFVIISDGLRYEVATEIASLINSQYRFKADIDSMLGVLPSYTALGMASLLPHKSLSYNEKGEVLADGHPTMSLEQRKEFLAPFNGTAVKLDDLVNMGREEGRNFVKSYNLIYIYHNHIDATGDALKTEEHTFNAVTTTINKINDLIPFLGNSLSANRILLTSDHGFLFQYSSKDETDRTTLADKAENAFISKKRYIIGKEIENLDNSINSNTNITAKTSDSIKFCVPKGANLYHFIGGARFVHGGSMPQEIVVPVLQIKQLKTDKAKETTKLKDVDVSVLGNIQRFTNKIQRFQLVQTEAVSDRTRPVTLKVAVYDDDDPITNVETITFDSKSDLLDERKKAVTLTLINRAYDRNKIYSLRLTKENGVTIQDINIKVDLVYDNDF